MGIDVYLFAESSPWFPVPMNMDLKAYVEERKERLERLGIEYEQDRPDGWPKTDEIWSGKWGYLRGSYFGGYSDVLRELFKYFDWDKQPQEGVEFDPEKYRKSLDKLKRKYGTGRPGSGSWKYLKDNPFTQSVHMAQEEPISDEYYKELEDFVNFAESLIEKGEKPRIYISY